MERPELSQEELERKLRTYFRQETAGIGPSDEWWNRALANLGPQDGPRRRPAWRAPSWLLHIFVRRVPLPAMAAAAASVALVAVATATVLLVGPGGAADAPRQAVADQFTADSAPMPTPAPAAAVPTSGDGARGRTVVALQAATEESAMVADFTATAPNVVRSVAAESLDSTAQELREGRLWFAYAGAAIACPERETTDALRENDFAFDGTVLLPATPAQSRVTFQVHRWLKGGNSPVVMVRMSSSTEGADILESGQRWLVTGNRNAEEPPRSGRCSMTQPYTQEAARAWEQALRR